HWERVGQPSPGWVVCLRHGNRNARIREAIVGKRPQNKSIGRAIIERERIADVREGSGVDRKEAGQTDRTAQQRAALVPDLECGVYCAKQVVGTGSYRSVRRNAIAETILERDTVETSLNGRSQWSRRGCYYMHRR